MPSRFYKSAFRTSASPEKAALLELKARMVSLLQKAKVEGASELSLRKMRVRKLLSIAEAAGFEFHVSLQRSSGENGTDAKK